jgi:hypothetical protein
MKYETKEDHSRQGNCLLKITYYKLRAKKQFSHYIIGQSIESYRASGAIEFLNQTLMILERHCIRETMRKKPKVVTRVGLCNSQRCSSTMESNLLDAVWNVMQTDYQNGAPDIDKSRRVIYD